MTSAKLDNYFDRLAATLAEAERKRSFAVTSTLAETLGLQEIGDGRPSQDHTWELADRDTVLRFNWRWRDQSRAFSTRPDMNVLTVSLVIKDETVRTASTHYED